MERLCVSGRLEQSSATQWDDTLDAFDSIGLWVKEVDTTITHLATTTFDVRKRRAHPGTVPTIGTTVRVYASDVDAEAVQETERARGWGSPLGPPWAPPLLHSSGWGSPLGWGGDPPWGGVVCGTVRASGFRLVDAFTEGMEWNCARRATASPGAPLPQRRLKLGSFKKGPG